MSLQFITETATGPKERRLIRSHVMKGKNAGRPRPPKRKLCHPASIKREYARSNPMGPKFSKALPMALDCNRTLHLKRLLWNDLTLASFPYLLNSEFRTFLHQWLFITAKALYPPEFCSPLDLKNYVWFRYTFEDKAFFHVILAISASFSDDFGGKVKVFPEALSHVSKAYQLINQRLSGPDAISDLAIAIVTVLAIYQNIHHQHESGLVHFDGLLRMIRLRGGIAKLMKENRSLAQKPWRLDIEFAIQSGSATHFRVNEVIDGTCVIPLKSRQPLDTIQRTPERYRNISPVIVSLLLSVANFTDFLNATNEGAKLDPLDYSESVFFLLHRLLQFAPLGDPCPPNLLDNLVHLTLTSIMISLMPEYGHNQAKYDLLSYRLRLALQNFASTDGPDHEILLWALFVGAVSVLDSIDDEWLLPLVANTCTYLDLRCWSDVRKTLCGFSWIGTLQDKLGKVFWSRLEGKGKLSDRPLQQNSGALETSTTTA